MTQTSSQSILAQLNELQTLSSVDDEKRRTARKWHDAINQSDKFLENLAHDIVFVGAVGIGKSSLIGIAANLLVDQNPKDKTSLKKNSVLATGGGRTTVCEVRIRTKTEKDKEELGLIIEPFSEEDMKKEIEIYAEDEWRRRSSIDKQRIGADDVDPTSQEIQRAIRGITNYVERQESYTDEHGNRKRRTVRPLDEAITRFNSASDFANHLIERTELSKRNDIQWWWNTVSIENLKLLKARFEAVNLGIEPTAMLPRRMTVIVPESLPNSQNSLNLTLIDTRGLDGAVESREDLQQFLRDSRSLLVLCAPFKQAPGEDLRALIRSMANDAQLRQAISRTLLVLLDQGDAEQVNGANGDREFGQELKIDECYTALEGSGLAQMLNKSQIVAFDALQDNRTFILNAIDTAINQIRQTVDNQLKQHIENATLFLNSVNDELRPALRKSVDDAIKKTMLQHLLIDTPLRDPLLGLYQAISETRYASVIYATCRRNGTYSKLNLYAAVGAEASRAATLWLDALFNAIFRELDSLEQDTTYEKIKDDIRLRRGIYQHAQLDVIGKYAEQVREQVFDKLKNDSIWGVCRSEWGQGDGFKNKVIDYMERWSRKQQGITAHEHTDAVKLIPLLGEVAQPAQAPRFMVYVRNLRALYKVNWSPEPPVTILIGANGAGKTTLLQTLRLFKLAYERGLPEAVNIVLGGSGNLRTWRANEDEPIEIGLNIGDIRWRIQLVTRESSVEYLTNEHLFNGERQIFSRNSLGEFTYGDERIEPGQYLGLRMLMDRGVHDSAIRLMSAFLQNITVFHDPDLWMLRHQGSNTTEDRYLHSRGSNVLALLRRWHQERTNHHRYQFVIEGLSSAFPNTFEEMDFVEAGNTLVARIYRVGKEMPSALSDEANGILQLLILLCEVASAEDESIIAIDEPENSLHPYALRAFLRRTTQWAKKHNLTVLLATHSTVLLDELTGSPEQVYVMKPSESNEQIPSRLDLLCNRDWLEGFKLGDLYEQGEIGSNEDEE
jgi:predicted ATPase